MSRGKHVIVIGLGNIGSPLISLLARLGHLARLTLIDRDVYEDKNRSTQAISPHDVGRPKADVQAERASQIQPDLQVEAVRSDVDDVPLGRMRGDVMLTGLDSKLARQSVNSIAWRLGVPWIDGGVAADGWLARMTTYLPHRDQPCLECAWTDRDYETLDVRRPCGKGAPATNAPAFLGSFVASLMAAECQKFLSGGDLVGGREVIVDLAHHQMWTTSYRRNPTCRFDHETWLRAGTLNTRLTVREALDLAEGSVGVEGKMFSTALRCQCGNQKPVLRLTGRLTDADRQCELCGELMSPVGFDALASLTRAVSVEVESLTLDQVGLRPGDIITGAAGRHLEVIP